MTHTIIAFFVGSTLGVVVALFMSAAIHGRQKEDWQAEYRRLMGGIYIARDKVLNLNITRGEVAEILSKTWLGDKI